MKNFISICVLMLLYSTASAAELKIGVVSVEKIIAEAPQVEAVNKSMMEKFGDKRVELQDLGKKIKTMEENYKRNELVMTEDKLNELKNKIIGNIQSFKKMEAELGKEVQDMRNKELASLQQAIRDIINNIAKKNGYDLILSDGVVFHKDKFDISSQVLDKMKKNFKAKKK